MAPSLPLRLPRSDAFASPTTADQQTREAPGGTRESLGNTTWAVVAIVLGAFLMVTLVIFAVLYYMRWRQLAQTTAAAALAAARDGGGSGNGSDWEEPAGGVRQPQQQHHRSPRLPLDPKAAVVVAVGRARAASSSSLGGGPRRGLRRMTSEDQAEAHELERALMIRKSLASRESWGSNASSQNSNSNNNSNSQNGNGNNTTTTRDEAGHATPASRHRSHDSLKSWEAGADGSRRNSRVVLPAASAESLRGHPALEGHAAPSSRTSLVPPAPALERRRMSPLPPLPSVHTR